MPPAGVTGARVSAQRGAPGDAPRRALQLGPGHRVRAAALGHVAEQLGGRGGVVGERDQGGVLAVVLRQDLGAARRGHGEPAEALGEQAGVDEEPVVLGQVAQPGGEPHGGGVLVAAAPPRPPSPSSPARAAAAASAATDVADGAAERGRLFGRALAGVRGRDQRAALVGRQLARRDPQALRQRALPVPPAQVAEQLLHALRVDAVAERLGGLVVQQVRLVDDDVLERRQRLAAREQQRVVDADEVRRLGAAARQAPVAAAPRAGSSARGRWRATSASSRARSGRAGSTREAR